MPTQTHTDKPDTEQKPTHRTAAKREAKFSRARLLGTDGEKITGQPRHVIAGALNSHQGDEFTREEARAAVKDFLERKVGPDKKKEASR